MLEISRYICLQGFPQHPVYMLGSQPLTTKLRQLALSNVSHETQIVGEQTVHFEENILITVQVWHIQILLIWKAAKQLVYDLLRVFDHLPYIYL